MAVYEYVTSNPKQNENILTIEFTFPISITKDNAIEQIDQLMTEANGNPDFTFTSHEPKFFEKSMETEEE